MPRACTRVALAAWHVMQESVEPVPAHCRKRQVLYDADREGADSSLAHGAPLLPMFH